MINHNIISVIILWSIELRPVIIIMLENLNPTEYGTQAQRIIISTLPVCKVRNYWAEILQLMRKNKNATVMQLFVMPPGGERSRSDTFGARTEQDWFGCRVDSHAVSKCLSCYNIDDIMLQMLASCYSDAHFCHVYFLSGQNILKLYT